MAGPVPKYGVAYDPRGTRVTGADGKQYLFGSVADAYRPGPPEPAAPPPQVFDVTPSQYDAPTMAALQQISAQRQRIERERAANPPMSMRDAIAGDDRVAGAIEGTEPDSPQARLDEVQRVRDNPGAAVKTFARSAAVGALDTAALPVTLPARALRAARDSSMDATGERTGLDTAADLSADEALQDATWLASGEDAGAYRQRVAKEREAYPGVAAAGAELGSAAAMAPLGPLAATERGIAGRISQRTAEERVRVLGRAYTDAIEMGDDELAASLKKRIQRVRPYRGPAEKRALGRADLEEKDRIEGALQDAELQEKERRRLEEISRPERVSATQAERRRIDEWRVSQGQDPIFNDKEKGLAFAGGSAPVPSASGVVKTESQRKQQEYGNAR